MYCTYSYLAGPHLIPCGIDLRHQAAFLLHVPRRAHTTRRRILNVQRYAQHHALALFSAHYQASGTAQSIRDIVTHKAQIPPLANVVMMGPESLRPQLCQDSLVAVE